MTITKRFSEAIEFRDALKKILELPLTNETRRELEDRLLIANREVNLSIPKNGVLL